MLKRLWLAAISGRMQAPLSAHDSLIQNQSVNLTFPYFHTKNAILIEITCTQIDDRLNFVDWTSLFLSLC